MSNLARVKAHLTLPFFNGQWSGCRFSVLARWFVWWFEPSAPSACFTMVSTHLLIRRKTTMQSLLGNVWG